MTEIKNKLEARNIGLDFARIFAMLGVVILHVLGNGGLLTTVGPTDKRFWIAWITEIFAFGSVNLFGLLSGYLSGGKKRFSTYRILDLIFTVIFYCVLITALFFAFGKNLLSEVDTVAYGLEFYKMGTYWYVFAYIVLFFLMPYINILINNLETKALGRLCLVIFILFSVVTTVTATDTFRLNGGYDPMWIILCYMIGAYLKKSGKTFFRRFEIPVFLLSVLSSLAILIIGYFKFGDDGFTKAKNISINYVAPLMFLNALMIFQFLASRKTKKINVGFKKFIVGISAVAFDVYIIHCHLFIYEQLIKGNFRWILDYPAASLPFIVIGCALGIYIACTLIGRVRLFLFKVLGINKLLKLIASKLDKALCWA